MRGHIRELSGGRWQVMWDIGRDPVSGRRRQRSRVVHGSRVDAEIARDRVLRDLEVGRTGGSGRTLLSTFVDAWLEAMRSQVRPTTWRYYEQKARSYVVPALGQRRLGSIRVGDLNVFYARLLESGRADGGGLSPASVRHVHRTVRRLLRDAVRWGWIGYNPAETADVPAVGRPELQIWSAEQVAVFLEAVSDDRWYAAWLLAVMTGMRRGEIVGLRWRDVDDTEIRVRQTIPKAGEFSEPKTRAGRRTVTIDQATSTALQTRRRVVAAERLAAGEDYCDLDLVFAWGDGSSIDPNLFSRWFRRHSDRAGLPPIRFHDLRHTSATLALAAGVPAKVVSERIGHASVAITLDLYTHRVDDLHRDAATQIAGLVGL